ncbi:MAG: adenylosuccinate lyase [Pseudomonadota bacterium]
MTIKSISPLDGRYASKVAGLSDYFSEWGLIRYRLRIEVEWLLKMSEREEISHVRPFNASERGYLASLITDFDEHKARRVKEIEKETNHDVKSVEYYIKECIRGTSLEEVRESVHFCCTSEDINNLAYALMLKEAIQKEWLPSAEGMVDAVTALALETRDTPMLTRTHGQPASPSTIGKELAVFVYRWKRQLRRAGNTEFLGKFNGAVGSYNAHAVAYPDAPWEEISRSFVEGLGLTFNPLTTQIEPHDYMAELFHTLMRFNSITVNFDRDMWFYIALGYFRQKVIGREVGSSIMPHKVNPIDFENSEANMGLSNALLGHLASNLTVSRMQRDLTDSSTLRNIGTAIGHALIGLKSTMRGLGRVAVDEKVLQRDLEGSWEVLAEAIQMVMRKAGFANPYERMKELTRGTAITREEMRSFIQGLDLPEEEKERLLALTPATYTGLARELVACIL